MVVYSVYTKNICTTYKTTICSKSTVFLIVITFFSFFLPLMIAYRSQGFWVKFLSYREQPSVHYKYQYFLYIETDNENEPVLCTTLIQDSEITDQFNSCTSVKANEMDNNGDGKLDELQLQIEVNTRSEQAVYSVYLVLVYDYILQHQCLLQMESLVVLQSSYSKPGRKLTVIGDLQLFQKTLLPCRGRDLRYNTTIFDPENELNVGHILKEYTNRNVTTRLDNIYTQWTRGKLGGVFSLDIRIYYSEVTFLYRPGFWPMMKWAWVQYLPILVLFLGLAKWVKGFVFMNHLLPTISYAPWKKHI